MQILPCSKEYDYTESPQSNPLRWTILYRVNEQTFQAQTIEFKCKDYFNECVALYHGDVLPEIYGFVPADLKLNDEGVYVLLNNIADKACYEANVGSINNLAAQYGMPPITLMPHNSKSYIALMPRKFFDSTWLTSLVTYLLRVANVKEVVADPSWKVHPTVTVDCPFRNQFDKVMNQGFKTPCDVQSYYYAGQKGNYKEKPHASCLVHNNGVASWTNLLTAEGKM